MLTDLYKNGFLLNMVKQLNKAHTINKAKSRFLFRDPSLPFSEIHTFDPNVSSREFETLMYETRFYDKLADAAEQWLLNGKRHNPNQIIKHESKGHYVFFAAVDRNVADLMFSNQFLDQGFIPTHNCQFIVPILDENNEEHKCCFYVLLYKAARKFFPISLS